MLEKKVNKIKNTIELLKWEVQGLELKGTRIELCVKHRGCKCYKNIYADNTRDKNFTKEVYVELKKLYN